MKKILFLLLFAYANSYSQTTVELITNRDLSLGYHDYHNTENTNYGGALQNAGFVIPGTYGGVNSNRALIDFDFTSIPSGATITSAYLNLYAWNTHPNVVLSQGHSGDNSCYLRRVISPWEEFVTTWNTQPNATTTNEVIVSKSNSSSQDYLIDVTQLVQDMIDNPSNSYGFLLGLLDENLTRNLAFHSKDGPDNSKYPKLVLTYNEPQNCQTINLTTNRDLSLGYHFDHNTENTNYGNALQNAGFVIPGNRGGVNSNRALIDFDLSSIPTGTTVTSAFLNLYAWNTHPNAVLSQGHSGDNACYLRRVISPWEEFVTTWNTQPSATNINEVIVQKSDSSNQDYVIDVTQLVQDIIDNPMNSYGFLLGLLDENLTRNLAFHSKDGPDSTKFPKLTVTINCNTNSTSYNKTLHPVLNLYPNPTQSRINISTSLNEDIKKAKVSITDIQGKEMFSREYQINTKNFEENIDVSELPKGLYLLNFKANDVVINKRVLIR